MWALFDKAPRGWRTIEFRFTPVNDTEMIPKSEETIADKLQVADTPEQAAFRNLVHRVEALEKDVTQVGDSLSEHLFGQGTYPSEVVEAMGLDRHQDLIQDLKESFGDEKRYTVSELRRNAINRWSKTFGKPGSVTIVLEFLGWLEGLE